jgi:toxin FitB
VSFLVDTNVISEIHKKSRCDKQVAKWFKSIEDEDLYLSPLVIGEIRRGIEKARPKGRTRRPFWNAG